MSNTRHAQPGSGPSDERYASDPAFCRGLKSGDVMRRCELFDDPRAVELALFLQYASNLSGGLEKVAQDLLTMFPDRFGTPALHRYKTAKGYTSKEVGDALFKERTLDCRDAVDLIMHSSEDCKTASSILRVYEDAYTVVFKRIPALLREFCLNPATSLQALCSPAFRDLSGALLEYMDRWETRTLAPLVVTELGGKVVEALNYAEDQKCLALVEGFARTGKTYISRAWCEARPGRRRFVSLSEATSDKEFFREIAKAIGSASSYGFKTNELRERINDILRPGFITLVLDEAHFLWPSRNMREASPRRIEWVRSSLANYSVPVAMIATHQFTKAQQQIEKHTNWSSEQLIGRIAFCAKLPDHLKEADIAAVARFHLPDAEERTIAFLVDYVVASKKHLASIEHGVKAARHEASKAGRDKITHKDVMVGFSNTLLPSDQALASAAEGSKVATKSKATRSGVTAARKISAPPERETGAALSVSVKDRDNNRSVVLGLSTV